MSDNSDLAELVDCLRLELSLSDEQATRVASRIQQTFAGERLYIRKAQSAIRDRRNANIRRDRKRGDTYTVLANRYDLSRAQICAIVHRDLSK